MKSAVCTLFEGNYHYGVGALTNSLYHYGFRGVIWAGYRGVLPPWAKTINEYENYQEYIAAEGFAIRFIKLDTDYHFTNYKPNFMLDLWKDFCPDTEALFYFDPDIVIKCRWSYYEEWVSYGIALCEDTISPVLNSHPLRMAWRKYYEPYGWNLDSTSDIYVNGGFIGVERSKKEFLVDWYKMQNLMSLAICGGLQKNNVQDRAFMFCKTDQDALNAALMATRVAVSLIGKEGMDIIYGGFTMSHALGETKPWKGSTLANVVIKGKGLSLAVKEYWKHTQSPIQLYSQLNFSIKKFELILVKFLARLIAHG